MPVHAVTPDLLCFIACIEHFCMCRSTVMLSQACAVRGTKTSSDVLLWNLCWDRSGSVQPCRDLILCFWKCDQWWPPSGHCCELQVGGGLQAEHGSFLWLIIAWQTSKYRSSQCSVSSLSWTDNYSNSSQTEFTPSSHKMSKKISYNRDDVFKPCTVWIQFYSSFTWCKTLKLMQIVHTCSICRTNWPVTESVCWVMTSSVVCVWPCRLLDSFHDLNKMICRRYKRANGVSRDLLLKTLHLEQPHTVSKDLHHSHAHISMTQVTLTCLCSAFCQKTLISPSPHALMLSTHMRFHAEELAQSAQCCSVEFVDVMYDKAITLLASKNCSFSQMRWRRYM